MNISPGLGSSSGSSSIGGYRSLRRDCAPRCKCGSPCVVYTSKTHRNPNRAFFGCLNFKEKKPYCDFFRWVDDATYCTMEMEEGRMNKLEMNVAEMEFKLKYVDMKLTDLLQSKVNEQQLQINDQQIRINELSMKMVNEFDRVGNEVRHVGICVRVLAAVVIALFILCIYVGSRVE